jgi:hypothetical protein
MLREYIGSKIMLRTFDELVAKGTEEELAYLLAARDPIIYECEKALLEDGIPDAKPLTHEMSRRIYQVSR